VAEYTAQEAGWFPQEITKKIREEELDREQVAVDYQSSQFSNPFVISSR